MSELSENRIKTPCSGKDVGETFIISFTAFMKAGSGLGYGDRLVPMMRLGSYIRKQGRFSSGTNDLQ